VSFTTKYAVPHQIKPRIPNLSILEDKATQVLSLFLLAAKKKTLIGCFGRTAQLDCRSDTNHFFAVFSLFLIGRYNKTLNDWHLGKQ